MIPLYSIIKQVALKKETIVILFSILFFSCQIFSQDIYDSANVDAAVEAVEKYNFTGYFRSGIFADENSLKCTYAEGSLKLNVTGNEYGSAFAEARYLASNNDNSFELREGYLNLFLGSFDFRFGRQIIVWGRADGFNPTNNITPTDFTVFSPDEDDKRIANFVVKSVYNFHPFNIEINWVPLYKTSVLPFEKAELPSGVEWIETDWNESKWENSSLGIKLGIEEQSFDGSASYYYGFHKLPGILFDYTTTGAELYTSAHKTQIVGLDFSTSFDNYGLRGEFALSLPTENNDLLYSIPSKQLEYTLGIDTEWNNFGIILQYVGKFIFDFKEKLKAQNSFEEEIVKWNRMIFSQQKKWNHSISLRPSLNLFYETLKLEMLGFANFSTEEVFLLPKATYAVSDAYNLIIGAQLFYGPGSTLYGFMKRSRNAVFTELKISF